MKHHPAHPDYRNRFTLRGAVNFDPGTLVLAATAAQAVGSIAQGNAQAQSYNSQAKAMEYNAQVNRINAERTASEYSVREDNLRRAQKIALGNQRAAMAESGVGAGTGTNLAIREDDTAVSELDALTLRYEGDSQRKAYLQQATLNDYEAKGARNSAKAAVRSGYIGAVSSALAGGYKYSNMGVPSAGQANYAPGANAASLPWIRDVRAGTARPNPYL